MRVNSGSWQAYLFRVIVGDETGAGAYLVRIFLSGLEVIYRMFSKLIFVMSHRHRLPVPVISVGNITVGGTGKTPTVIWLVKLLKEAGFTPAILTRGYGGKYQEDGLYFTSATAAALTPKMTGD